MTLRLNQTPDELRLEQLAQEILPKDRPKRGRPRKREVAANPGIADALLEYHSLTAGGKGKTVKWVGFQQQYRNDPVAFVHDCLYWDDGKGPSFYQDEIIGGLPEWKRAAIRGPHGLGKTAMMAWKTWWWALTRDGLDWKCPSTASSWNQLIKYLWPEIHKWSKKVRWDKVGRAAPDRVHELQTLALKLGTGEAFAVTSDQPELIEGCHADHLLFLYDESKAIPERTFDAVEGAFSTPGDILVAAYSTPGPPNGRFYDIHMRKPGFEDWHVVHVTLDMAVKAGRVDPKWAEARARQWGESSAMYQNRVLGEFCNSAEDGIIPLSWINAAVQRWKDCKGEFGEFMLHSLDVAGLGADQCARAERYEKGIGDVILSNDASTMETVGKLKKAMEQKPGPAVIDVIGVGAGVYDRADELDLDVEAFNSTHSAKGLTDKSGELTFLNQRAAAWWQLRERLDPDLGDGTVLPPIARLIEDLAMPRWSIASNGSIVIESKKEMRKRAGRSPDAADAVVMALYSEAGREVKFF
jgi:hypothetical protein